MSGGLTGLAAIGGVERGPVGEEDVDEGPCRGRRLRPARVASSLRRQVVGSQGAHWDRSSWRSPSVGLRCPIGDRPDRVVGPVVEFLTNLYRTRPGVKWELERFGQSQGEVGQRR